jgi:hypothetical protein
VKNNLCRTATFDQISSGGGNSVQVIRIPFPAAGKSLIDYQVVLPKPANSLYYPTFKNEQTPEVGYSFTPASIDLNNAVALGANGAGLLINLETDIVWKWQGTFQTIYFSVNGAGAGGILTLLAFTGFDLRNTIAKSGGGGGTANFNTIGVGTVTSQQIPFGGGHFQDILLDILDIPFPISITNVAINVTNTDGVHTADIGLYDLAGNLVFDVGPTLFSAGGAHSFPLAQGTTLLSPGRYLWAICWGTGFSSFGMQVYQATEIITPFSTATIGAVNGQLPSTITPVQGALVLTSGQPNERHPILAFT